MIEIFARSRRSFQNAGVGRLGVPVINPSPLNKVICVFVCLVPLAIGFFGPLAILVKLFGGRRPT